MTLRLRPATRSARILLLAAVLAVPTTAAVPAFASVPETANTAPQEHQSVSDRYAAPGSHAVEFVEIPGYQLFYPADIATGSDRFPVVTFGNGSYATYEQYEGLLRHFASWGFVVVVADSSVTGDGTEILAAARDVVARNGNPASIFHNRIDVDHIAAVGHSQGAGGAINASTNSGGLIASTAVLDLPDPWWASRPVDVIDVTRLTGPVFYLTGADDPVSTAIPQAAYHAISPGPAARGRLLGVGHNWPSDGGGFRGYLTAWLRFTLTGDTDAARAFTGPTPELLSDPAWDGTAATGW
ncbi:alpha/beta hydrolase [Prescottella subtropica]|uniref:poly(ethylene terephthalate) hydrolase family protein n=1 Tax=Prescottella subtropica TaxID=2545757 RepID=UPI001F500DC7|nr:alpha/beta hydrolase [Prescottella subtropica]